jgi:hypothetical protein
MNAYYLLTAGRSFAFFLLLAASRIVASSSMLTLYSLYGYSTYVFASLISAS